MFYLYPLIWQKNFNAIQFLSVCSLRNYIAIFNEEFIYIFLYYWIVLFTFPRVEKARIALERGKFLKNAEMAVQRQAMWSNLAHEMTAEFRGLCAEEV